MIFRWTTEKLKIILLIWVVLGLVLLYIPSTVYPILIEQPLLMNLYGLSMDCQQDFFLVQLFLQLMVRNAE